MMISKLAPRPIDNKAEKRGSPESDRRRILPASLGSEPTLRSRVDHPTGGKLSHPFGNLLGMGTNTTITIDGNRCVFSRDPETQKWSHDLVNLSVLAMIAGGEGGAGANGTYAASGECTADMIVWALNKGFIKESEIAEFNRPAGFLRKGRLGVRGNTFSWEIAAAAVEFGIAGQLTEKNINELEDFPYSRITPGYPKSKRLAWYRDAMDKLDGMPRYVSEFIEKGIINNYAEAVGEHHGVEYVQEFPLFSPVQYKVVVNSKKLPLLLSTFEWYLGMAFDLDDVPRSTEAARHLGMLAPRFDECALSDSHSYRDIVPLMNTWVERIIALLEKEHPHQKDEPVEELLKSHLTFLMRSLVRMTGEQNVWLYDQYRTASLDHACFDPLGTIQTGLRTCAIGDAALHSEWVKRIESFMAKCHTEDDKKLASSLISLIAVLNDHPSTPTSCEQCAGLSLYRGETLCSSSAALLLTNFVLTYFFLPEDQLVALLGADDSPDIIIAGVYRNWLAVHKQLDPRSQTLDPTTRTLFGKKGKYSAFPQADHVPFVTALRNQYSLPDKLLQAAQEEMVEHVMSGLIKEEYVAQWNNYYIKTTLNLLLDSYWVSSSCGDNDNWAIEYINNFRLDRYRVRSLDGYDQQYG